MIKEILNKIENKRHSSSPFFRFLVFNKDLVWRTILLVKSIQRPNAKNINSVNFAVTYLCNSKCRACNIWKKYKENPKKIKEELKLEEIKKIFNDSKYLKNLNSISLTGGEPFLRKDFVELCGFFIKKYPSVGINIPTNSINLNLILNKLKEIVRRYNPKKLNINVSLDGIKKTHDRMRGISGSYDDTLKLIDCIKKIPSISVGINFTIMPENYKDILKVYKFSKKKKIFFSCQFGQISECYYENFKNLERFKWTKGKLKDVEEKINLIINDYKKSKNTPPCDKEIYFLSNMIKYQKNSKRTLKCYSGINSCFIDPYGDIFPCIILNNKLGNAKNGFDKIWFSEKAKRARRFIKNKKCSCWTPCETYNSLDYNRELIFSGFAIFCL